MKKSGIIIINNCRQYCPIGFPSYFSHFGRYDGIKFNSMMNLKGLKSLKFNLLNPIRNWQTLIFACEQLWVSVHHPCCNHFSKTFSVTGYSSVLFYSSDDIDHRSSHTNIAQASSVPFAPPQMPVSASMPWLGSGQTSMGASVVWIYALQMVTYTNTAKPGSNGYVVLSDSQ